MDGCQPKPLLRLPATYLSTSRCVGALTAHACLSQANPSTVSLQHPSPQMASWGQHARWAGGGGGRARAAGTDSLTNH